MMSGQARSSVVVIRDSTPRDHLEAVPASVPPIANSAIELAV
jgi:hypothetical protein